MAIDKIGSKALTDCSVVAADIAPGTVTGTQLAGSIANAKLANSTVTINGTAIALGASASIAAVAWQSVVVSDGSTVTTMVAGRGYFVNNTSAAGIVKLPASASAGDTIAIKDYAGNFATNKLTIQRNSHKIQGDTTDSLIGTNRASIVLVYIDATKGWLYTNESNVNVLGALFTAATGGTVTTSGDFKIHSFTGDSNFVVSQVGNCAGGGNKVSYVVVAGGAGGGAGSPNWTMGGGGGAGGFREAKVPSDSYTDSPLDAGTGLTVAAQTYPITVGGGGAGGTPGAPAQRGVSGSNSVFSTITSHGGGGGGGYNIPGGQGANTGGSGGGGGNSCNSPGIAGANGNTPPVSPSQGNAGGDGNRPFAGPSSYQNFAGGGGGATAAGGDGGPTGDAGTGGAGGAGATTHITGSPVVYSGGGGGGGAGVDNQPGSASAIAGRGGDGGTGGGGNGMTVGRTHSPHNIPWSSSSTGGAGTANTGGGGGGGGSNGDNNTPEFGRPGGAGGKGIVIIRYKFQ